MVTEPCAITCRVSPSFVRVGHLDLFARRARTAAAGSGAHGELAAMVRHAMAREYPHLLSPADAAPLGRYGVARSYPRCLGDYAPIRAHLRNAPSCPGAEELAARLHTLPTHQYVTEADRLVVVRAVSGTKR